MSQTQSKKMTMDVNNANEWISRLNALYEKFATTCDFSVFDVEWKALHKDIQDSKQTIQDELNTINQQERNRSVLFVLPSSDNSFCFLKEPTKAEKYKYTLEQKLDACEKNIREFHAYQSLKTQEHLQIMKRVLDMSDGKNEQLSQFYYVRKHQHDCDEQAVMDRKNARRLQRENDLNKYEKAMDDAWHEYQRRVKAYEQAMEEDDGIE